MINYLLNKLSNLLLKLLTLPLLHILLPYHEPNQREYVIGPSIIPILYHDFPLIHLH